MQKILQTQLANQIRLDKLNNPYLKGSQGLSAQKINTPSVELMQKINGVPVPLQTSKPLADILAVAKQESRKSAWNLSLSLPDIASSASDLFNSYLKSTIKDEALHLFQQHSQKVILSFGEKTSLLPFHRLIKCKQEKYFKVKDSGYSAWSLRAYQIGHQDALNMANLAYRCRVLNKKQEMAQHDETIEQLIELVRQDPDLYQVTKTQRRSILKELSFRFHALAIQQDIIALNSYLDYYQYSYSQRTASFHKNIIEKHGKLGRTLIDCMLCEEKHLPFQFKFAFEALSPLQSTDKSCNYNRFRTDSMNYGDHSYYKKSNSPLLDRLLNGMDNSIGDIGRVVQLGELPQPGQFGAWLYLPRIDNEQLQSMPLIVLHQGQLFLRRETHSVRQLNTAEYQQLLHAPENWGYKPLTPPRALKASLQWRILHFVLSEQKFNPQLARG